MSLYKSNNPALSENKFRSTTIDSVIAQEGAMTIKGTINKFGFLTLMVLASSFYSWKEYVQNGAVLPLILAGSIGGLVVAIIIVFKQQWSPYLAPLYAILEGLFIGAISAAFSTAFADRMPNIVINAVGLTFGVAVSMYFLYTFRIIKVTQKFRSVIITATMGIMIFYVLVMVMRWMGFTEMPFLHEGSILGIVFSLFVVTIASLNLLLDFDMIEKGAEMGAPKYMEWYGAFGLLVTIIWLYLEILRLLSKLASRR